MTQVPAAAGSRVEIQLLGTASGVIDVGAGGTSVAMDVIVL
jgi:hypothetical protein